MKVAKSCREQAGAKMAGSRDSRDDKRWWKYREGCEGLKMRNCRHLSLEELPSLKGQRSQYQRPNTCNARPGVPTPKTREL
jgi:hypothetical protein